jgi:hypothetical protein
MAKGKPAQVRIVEDIPVRYDDTDEDAILTITGTTTGRIRFSSDEGEAFEMDLDDLVEAIIYVDQTGTFAKRIVDASNAA